MIENWPKKKYSIIYADPPWEYRVWSKKEGMRTARSHYDVMSDMELGNLEVGLISEKDSVLFLWVTAPKLPVGIQLGEEWGFEYKTIAFNWVKRNKKNKEYFLGMGHYTRANVELCLLFTRGKILPRLSRSVRQICDSAIEQHSKKPDYVRDRIVELFGDLPRIELFSRQKVKGWDCWGLEVEETK